MDGTVQCEELSKAWVEPIHRRFAIDLKRNQEDWDKPVFLGSVVEPSSARRRLIKIERNIEMKQPIIRVLRACI